MTLVSRTSILLDRIRDLTRDSWFFGLGASVLTFSVLLGGGARQGYSADVALQLVAVPLFAIAIARIDDPKGPARLALAFCMVLFLVPLIQLLPLPPGIWSALPFRDIALQSLQLTDRGSSWWPLSLSPHATWQSLLSLIPPVAMFLAVLSMSWKKRQILCGLIVGLGVLISFLGLVQAGQGGAEALQDSMWKSNGFSMGVFANRNHFAALLYTALLIAAAFAIDFANRATVRYGETFDSRMMILAVISFTVIVALLAGQMISRSRAGLGLTIVALLAIAAMANSGVREKSGLTPTRLMASAVILVLIFGSQFALFQIMERFAADPLQDARVSIARNTTSAAWSVMPWGSGLGSFVPVYQYFEGPKDVIVGAFINRAHNDVLEVWLETGLAGVILMAAFAIWLAGAVWRIWWREDQSGSPLDQSLVRAATLAIILLLAHSLVDYPLRTTAMMSVFAVFCGLLFDPITNDRESVLGTEERGGASTLAAGAARREKIGAEQPAPVRAPPATSPRPVARETWNWPAASDQTGHATPGSLPSTSASSTQRTANPAGTENDLERWGANLDWPEDWKVSPDRREGPEKKD